MLDERGQSLRHSEGLIPTFRCFIQASPSAENLRISESHSSNHGCRMLAHRLCPDSRFYTTDPSSVETNPVDFSLAFGSETSGESRMALTEDRENLIFTILEARADVGLTEVDILEATDPVSLAFAPILGSTGLGFDDLETEIRSIEGTMGR